MTPAAYKAEREKRGTQAAVAALLGVARTTLSGRESGDPRYPISQEAWLALLSLPLAPSKPP